MGRYNTNKINDEFSIGYDNFEKRLENSGNPESKIENRELAHENIYDKFLAEYYLGKRVEYAKSKELLEQLNQEFTYLGYKEGHKYKTLDD